MKVEYPLYDIIVSGKGTMYQVFAKYGNRYVVSKFEKRKTEPSNKMYFITKSFFDSCKKIRKSQNYDINLFFAGCFIEENERIKNIMKTFTKEWWDELWREIFDSQQVI